MEYHIDHFVMLADVHRRRGEKFVDNFTEETDISAGIVANTSDQLEQGSLVLDETLV